jgi:hypothetical protein
MDKHTAARAMQHERRKPRTKMTASTTNIEARREADRRQAALGWVARQLEWERVLTGLRARRDTDAARRAA